jgi:prepilin-type N-terminal cleavage/methylation domain-containing protein
MQRGQYKQGFTIVELLIVIVVIGILAAITVVAYSTVQVKARDADRKTDVATIIKMMESYYALNGRYPASGGSTAINGSWSTTADASWQTFAAQFSPSVGSTLPVDPQVSGTPAISGGSNYDIYVNTGTYCGSAVGQMYLLVYHLEGSAQVNKASGDCTTDPLNYYSAGSNYRVAK